MKINDFKSKCFKTALFTCFLGSIIFVAIGIAGIIMSGLLLLFLLKIVLAGNVIGLAGFVREALFMNSKGVMYSSFYLITGIVLYIISYISEFFVKKTEGLGIKA